MSTNDLNPPESAAAKTRECKGAEKSILLSGALAWIGLSISILLVQQHAGVAGAFLPGACELRDGAFE